MPDTFSLNSFVRDFLRILHGVSDLSPFRLPCDSFPIGAKDVSHVFFTFPLKKTVAIFFDPIPTTPSC